MSIKYHIIVATQNNEWRDYLNHTPTNDTELKRLKQDFHNLTTVPVEYTFFNREDKQVNLIIRPSTISWIDVTSSC